MAACFVLTALFTGRWVAVSGARLPMTLGCVLAGVGVFLTDARLVPNSGVSSIGWTLALAGVGFGMAIVPVTSSALSVIPAERSGMAASMTSTSREIGAVAGVAVLGSIVNGQLTVNLIHRLTAIGVPRQFQNQIITGVTTGTFNEQASKRGGRQQSVATDRRSDRERRLWPSSHSLDIALIMAGALMLLSAVVAVLSLEPHSVHEVAQVAPAEAVQ